MGKERMASASGKRKQAKGPVLNGESQVMAGGELHQIAGGEHPALTTNQGVALSDNQNSLKADPRGPAAGVDFDRLATRAESQRDSVDERRLASARSVLCPEPE
jgi:hypothetical protein